MQDTVEYAPLQALIVDMLAASGCYTGTMRSTDALLYVMFIRMHSKKLVSYTAKCCLARLLTFLAYLSCLQLFTGGSKVTRCGLISHEKSVSNIGLGKMAI